MATKKKLTPADCDRWDTIPGAEKITSQPTPEQRKLVEKINAQRAAAAVKKKKK